MATAVTDTLFDVLIVGGGPAGLSAALTLSRALRKVLLCTKGKTRNAWSNEMHGYLTRDGISPQEFLQLGFQEIRKYGTRIEEAEIVKARRCADHFEVCTDDGRTLKSKKLLITTGVRDILPKIDGFEKYYGTSIHHCPYCDGWEHQGERIAVYAQGGGAVSVPYVMQGWSKHVTLCTDGATDALKDYDSDLLQCNNIDLIEKKITRIEGNGKQVQRIVFEDESHLACDTIFFSTGSEPRSNLPHQLGCKVTKKGNVKTDKFQQTNIGGLYVAGDASRDMQLVIVAAAEGAKAGVAINMALQAEAKIMTNAAKEAENGNGKAADSSAKAK